jgi:acyl-CoA dehydrogenase
MKRTLFNSDHEMFRDQFRKFVERELVPHYDQWEKEGSVPRDLWNKAGAQGFVCPWLPEEYGGVGADFLYPVIEI